MEPALLAAIIIPSIIGGLWVIYMFVHTIRRCIEINREYAIRTQRLDEIRRMIHQYDDRREFREQFREQLRKFRESRKSEGEMLDNEGWMTDPFDNTTDDECVVCLNALDKNCIMTKCYHKFHNDCIKKWEIVSKKSNAEFVCPICKQLLYQSLQPVNTVIVV